VIRQLRHEEALAQLWRARQYVGTGIQQAIDDRRPAGVHLVVEVGHGDGFQLVLLALSRIFGQGDIIYFPNKAKARKSG